MKKGLLPALLAVSLGISIYYSGLEALEWRDRGAHPPDAFLEFAREIRAAIPPEATLRIVTPGDVRNHKFAHLLNRELHPRRIQWKGPADWIVELPAGDFDRKLASYRRSVP